MEKLLAYLYTDPLLEPSPEAVSWQLTVARVYHDRAIAQATGKGAKATPSSEPRLAWQELIQECQTTAVAGVIVRQLEDLGKTIQAVSDRLLELETLQVPILVLAALPPDATLLSPLQLGESPAATLQRWQSLQQQQRSRQIRQGHARNRVKALPPPGKAPYGYRRTKTGYVVDRTTAPVVKDFFEQFLLYGSVRGAVRYLAKRYNKKISASTGQRWLTNAVYRGDLEYQDGNCVRDTHPAIISRDEAAQVDRLLRRNRRLPPRTASAPRSLAGLVTCADCHSMMTVARVTTPQRQQEYLYLRPRACPKQPKCAGLLYDDVLHAAIQRICEDLPRAISGAALPDMTQVKHNLQQAIAAQDAILQQLPALVASRILDQETADLRAYKVRSQIANLQDQLSQLPPVDLKATAQTLSIPQFWLDLSETERRAYLRELIREIQLVRAAAGWEIRLVFAFLPPTEVNRQTL